MFDPIALTTGFVAGTTMSVLVSFLLRRRKRRNASEATCELEPDLRAVIHASTLAAVGGAGQPITGALATGALRDWARLRSRLDEESAGGEGTRP